MKMSKTNETIDYISTLSDYIRNDFQDIELSLNKKIKPNTFFQVLVQHKLEGYIKKYSKTPLPLTLACMVNHACDAIANQNVIARSMIAELRSIAKDAGTRFAIIKGMSLNECIYGSEAVRASGDIDILVAPEDIMVFHGLLCGLGYSQKIGLSSPSPSLDRNSRAATALHANNTDRMIVSTLPIKTDQDKPEYRPYIRHDSVPLEMHDGLYFLSSEAVKSMLRDAVSIDIDTISFTTLNPEDMFILLLTNTYENSESFYSNTYNFKIALRDYVDIRFFLEKYKDTLDWGKIEQKIDKFGIRNIASIVIGNLTTIYGKDMTFDCLSSVKPKSSELGMDIFERIADPARTKEAVLCIMRQRWFSEAAESAISVYSATSDFDYNTFHKCDTYDEASFNIEYTSDTFVISWAILNESQSPNEDLLFQIKFFPLKNAVGYISYKVDLFKDNDVYIAYGHKTRRYTLGARRKKTGAPLLLDEIQVGYIIVLRVTLPFTELGIEDVYEASNLCACAEVYKRHYEEIYHRFASGLPEPRKHLLELE